ncbi:MAG TPA: hypothetical protein VIS27_14625, partial [Yeosuana sp.]
MSVDFFNNDVKLEQPKESVEADSSGKAGQNETIDLFSKEPEDDGIDQIIDKVESEEKAEEVEQPTLKELMAMYGEKEYRVPAEAKFKNKVNGEDVEFTVQEAINSYAGKGGWEKKFSELDKDRQAYKKDLESVNKYLQEFASKAKTDRVGAFEFLAEAVGIDPLEFRKGMRKDLLSKHQDYLSMDEQTRLAYEMKEENEYFKSKHAAELQRRTNEQANLEFEKRMSAVKTEHNISDDKLTELVSDLKEYGGIDKPSLDDIIALNTAYVRQDRAVDILNKVN